ncbi:hypothetical protein E2C06_00720 [Dankookia rubra]|uniref:Uncharacterized protein n=1 Tax=Dankookia rubra TaxID=1442381 RepID=A0A4R5QLU5_9PROT|nr:hypothetical protein [Dankookia rubra]TDH64500.1 hypothetical protein E2C06_00720 [Dankookia rubra]
MVLRIDPASVFAWFRRPLLVLGLATWVLVAFVATGAVGLDGPLGAGMVLGAAACAPVSAPASARLVGLDAEIRLVVSVLTMLPMPFTAPSLALGLLGLELTIVLPGLMLRLLAIVGLPALLALRAARGIGTGAVGPGRCWTEAWC